MASDSRFRKRNVMNNTHSVIAARSGIYHVNTSPLNLARGNGLLLFLKALALPAMAMVTGIRSPFKGVARIHGV